MSSIWNSKKEEAKQEKIETAASTESNCPQGTTSLRESRPDDANAIYRDLAQKGLFDSDNLSGDECIAYGTLCATKGINDCDLWYTCKEITKDRYACVKTNTLKND